MSENVAINSPDLDPSDPYARMAQTYPHLSEAMRHRAKSYGMTVSVAPGDVLFERGQRHVDFYIVLSGEVEIVYPDEQGAATVVTVHSAGEFTGEMDLLGGVNLVTARVRHAGTVLRFDRTAFRALTASEPDIGEIVVRALILRRMGFVMHGQAGAVLVGHGNSSEMLQLRRFLTRNNYPHKVLEVDLAPEAPGLLQALDLSPADFPAVIASGIPPLRNPTVAALSDALGLTEAFDESCVHDVAIVGGGPAGLATAVYAASEGLRTIVIEGLAPGGQAGTSSKIENFLGFPTGISGHALASRAQVQALKFGAKLLISRMATRLHCHGDTFKVELDDGRQVSALCVVIASGARYRRPEIAEYARFEGRGIHYAATPMEAQLCSAQDVVVVGGGNSAGQAAVYLSRHVRHVHMLIRGASLSATMSDYLVQRITRSPAITLHSRTEIAALGGLESLSSVTCVHRDSGQATTHAVGNVFIMIGAEPNTAWLDQCVSTDPRGFVLTGAEATGRSDASPFETSQCGVFAVGDVRAGSVKRVASGVGEGSVVVQDIHRHLSRAHA